MFLRGWECDGLFIVSPLACHKFKRAETDMDIMGKTCQIDAHKTYRTEVAYRSYNFLILPDRYAEAVPINCFGIAVPKFHLYLTFVGYVVFPCLEVLWP